MLRFLFLMRYARDLAIARRAVPLLLSADILLISYIFSDDVALITQAFRSFFSSRYATAYIHTF